MTINYKMKKMLTLDCDGAIRANLMSWIGVDLVDLAIVVISFVANATEAVKCTLQFQT